MLKVLLASCYVTSVKSCSKSRWCSVNFVVEFEEFIFYYEMFECVCIQSDVNPLPEATSTEQNFKTELSKVCIVF